jgi:NADPH-dependent F420 reductase
VTAPVAVLGGTGPLGRGLAERLVLAGHPVVVGSRDAARADAAAAAIRARTGTTAATGAPNLAATEGADVVVLAIPAVGLAALLDEARERLARKLVIDVVVPLAFRDGLAEHAPPPGAASAGELVEAALPASRVVSAFKNIPAAHFARLDEPLEGDVLVCGANADARRTVAALVERLPKLRAVDAGAMRNVRAIEGITALLVNLNARHHAHTSIRVLGLDGTHTHRRAG